MIHIDGKCVFCKNDVVSSNGQYRNVLIIKGKEYFFHRNCGKDARKKNKKFIVGAKFN